MLGAIFRENSRTINYEFRHFPWKFSQVKTVFAIFRENSRTVSYEFHYFPVKIHAQ